VVKRGETGDRGGGGGLDGGVLVMIAACCLVVEDDLAGAVAVVDVVYATLPRVNRAGRAGEIDRLGEMCALRGAELTVRELVFSVAEVVLVGVVCLCLAPVGCGTAKEAPGGVPETTSGRGGDTVVGLLEAGLLFMDALGLALRARIGAAALPPGTAGRAAAAGRFSVMGRAMGVAGALTRVILAVGFSDAVQIE